ncbi:MAG: AAA family ATPase [Candidatus Micrarchaeota archaeon]
MFVSKVMLQNFKSFRKGEIVFQSGFNSIVGPNGSGKTNVVDSILFALGESRLKGMRVKKIRDLIFQDNNVAEVTVILSDGSKERTIKRVLRKDGKIKYAIDGKRVKKYVLEEFLAQINLSTQHVIKQGEVQKIVEMHPKDRRGMIDFIAGVSDYEDKKKEAIGELDKVHSKVSGEKAVIAEKEGYLQELSEDKKNAEKFLQLDSLLKRTKATVLHLELTGLEKEFESLINSSLDLDNKIRALSDEIKSLEGQIAEKNRKKDEIHKQMIAKSEGKEGELQRQIDLLQNEIGNAKTVIEKNREEVKGKDKALQEASVDKRKAEDSLSYSKKELLHVEEELASAQKILSEKQADYDALVSQSKSFSSQFHSARAQMSSLEQELLQVKNSLGELQVEVASAEERKRLKQGELERLKTGQFEGYSDQKSLLEKTVEQAGLDLGRIDSLLKGVLEDEKKLLEKSASLDEERLNASQKINTADARLRAAGSSKAVETVDRIRDEVKGVFGTVQQLIDYNQIYSLPVSAALGQRMHYVVVDSVKTAGKAIDLLKKNNWGRLSFIPLDKIQDYSLSQSDLKLKKRDGAVDFLVNLLEFEEKFEKAVRFVCANTLVMKDFASAEELAREARLVTLEGELIEQSGLVSGGRAREEINPFVEAKELQKWEERLEKILAERTEVSSRLSQAREELGELRRKKAELEVAKTKAELELRHVTETEKAWDEKQKNVSRAAQELKQEVKQLDAVVEKKGGERNELVRRISDLNSKYLSAKELVDTEKEEQFGTMVREKEKRLSDLRVAIADYSSQSSAKKAECSSLAKQFEVLAKRERELEGEVRLLREESDAADERIRKNNGILREKVEEQKKVSSAMRDLYDASEAVDKEVSKLGEMKGKMQAELELHVQPKKEDVGYKRAAVEERLTGLKAQYSTFEGVELLEDASVEKRGEMAVSAKELEQEISALGPINMKSVDMYDEKLREFEQHKERLGQLENERKAVLLLIQEIEGKKKDTFMRSFDQVNENFSKLFKQVFSGDGILILENPEDPFQGGLTMQVKLENKDVKYLELMSGGEKSLLALIFIFALQGVNPSSVYVLDEADAALDEENSRKLANLLKALTKSTQFIVVTHNEAVYRDADCLVGVAMAGREGSKLVEVKLSQAAAAR